jgi:hypothetical protein
MTYRLGIFEGVHKTGKLGGIDLSDFRQKGDHFGDTRRLSHWPSDVQLHPVTGGQDYHFATRVFLDQSAQGPRNGSLFQGDLFAHFHRRRAVITTYD